MRSKTAFETKYIQRLQHENHQPGSLVLLQNVPVENTMSISCKTTHRYMGPYSIVQQTQGGSYVLQERNGNTLQHTVAAFRSIPYVKQEDLDNLVDEMEPESKAENNPS